MHVLLHVAGLVLYNILGYYWDNQVFSFVWISCTSTNVRFKCLSCPEPELCARRRFLKKSRVKEMMLTTSYGRLPAGLPPRLQPCPGNLAPVRSPGVNSPSPPQTSVAYEHCRSHNLRPSRGSGPSRLDNLLFNAPLSLCARREVLAH